MGLARDAMRVVTLAATAGIAVGGAIGVLAPAFAEAGPGALPPAAHAATAGADASVPALTVTSVDLLGRDRLEVTLRLHNTGRGVEHIDTAAIDVTAGGTALRHRAAGSATAVDLRPGATVEETVVFDAPAAEAVLTLVLPDGRSVPLG